MTKAVTVLRVYIQKELGWGAADRDRTLTLFLQELEEAVTPSTIEVMADKYPERFLAMFKDWAKFRSQREAPQRVSVLVEHVAKNATGLPFGYQRVVGEEKAAENVGQVVSFFR